MNTDKEKPQSEVKIMNDLVGQMFAELDKKTAEIENIKKALKKNQSNFYNWDKIEIGINSYINKDEQVFKQIQDCFGEGMLRAVMKRFIPELKKSLKELVDIQIELLKQ